MHPFWTGFVKAAESAGLSTQQIEYLAKRAATQSMIPNLAATNSQAPQQPQFNFNQQQPAQVAPVIPQIMQQRSQMPVPPAISPMLPPMKGLV